MLNPIAWLNESSVWLTAMYARWQVSTYESVLILRFGSRSYIIANSNHGVGIIYTECGPAFVRHSISRYIFISCCKYCLSFCSIPSFCRPKYISSFLICPNLNDSETFKSSSCKNGFLQCVCYRCNLLRWMFFVPCDNWKMLLFPKVCRYCEIFSTAILSFSLKQVFWKKSVFSCTIIV